MKIWLTAISIGLLSTAARGADVDFSHDIVPILRQHCGKCHTGQQKKGGLSFNTRAALLAGGENGAVVVSGKTEGELLRRVTSTDAAVKMPPEGEPVPAEKIRLLQEWVTQGLRWEEGFRFGPQTYEPPLRPRRPALPPVVGGDTHLINRVLQKTVDPAAKVVADEQFLRRVSLDLLGLLPTATERQAFLNDTAADKREKLVQHLLARDIDYAEHWLTFWNDLLRNDYDGTGFITGGRKQISRWLYDALIHNRPYDQFARDLIAPPTPESAGFIEGIRWRGEVSAGQTVEIQFAQSVGQSFLGINLKCASCHDSFIDRWKLEEAYGLAAVFATQPLRIHRCDLPQEQMAQPSWLFPELGQITATASQPERLKELAALLTHPENGRFTRTIVNRLWQRMLGRGIINPIDAMQTEPANPDLLDALAVDLADHHYDLKHTLALIATSRVYQLPITNAKTDQSIAAELPIPRRLTAEQFIDAVWQLTDAAPTHYDAPISRGKRNSTAPASPPSGQWIWTRADTSNSPAGETATFRRQFSLKSIPAESIAVISCDNGYTLYLNGKRLQEGNDWQTPNTVTLPNLNVGPNEILIVGRNAGSGPNPAGLYFEARLCDQGKITATIATDTEWQWTTAVPDAQGKLPAKKGEADDWRPAALADHPEVWSASLNPQLTEGLNQAVAASGKRVRSGLLKSDFLMRALGRPNRDQIVSSRPNEVTTLEAIDLSNGKVLAALLATGSQKLKAQTWESPDALIRWLYTTALCREETSQERQALRELLGEHLSETGIQDALWIVLMLPEFQFVQ